ncbi:MAG: peptidylprolyl isomerase [Polyangiales bacterium]
MIRAAKRPWWIALGLVLSCAAAVAQPVHTASPETPGRPPGTPDPAETPTEDEAPAVSEDAGVGWAVVPLVDASSPVATGRGLRVNASEVIARFHDASGALQEGYATDPSLAQELLDRMVADRLLADEARRRGLDADPLVRAAVERALVSRLRALVLNPAADTTRPEDDEVRAWYDAHPERFHIPERRRARVIFLTNRREALDVLRLALSRRRQRPVHEFRRLASEHNDDPHLRSMAGDLRDVTPTRINGGLDLDSAVRAAIFEIAREGDTLPRVVEGSWRGVAGYFIVNLVSRRRGEERSLAAQSDWIRLRIMMERRVAVERARVAELARERGVTALPLSQVLRFAPAASDGGALVGDASADR